MNECVRMLEVRRILGCLTRKSIFFPEKTCRQRNYAIRTPSLFDRNPELNGDELACESQHFFRNGRKFAKFMIPQRENTSI